MRKITFLLTLISFLALSWQGNAQLSENFDGATFPPTDWTLITGTGDFDQSSQTADHTTGAANFARYDCYNINGTTPAYLTTPRLVVSATDKTFSFWANYYLVSGSWGNTASLFVEASSDGGTTWVSDGVNYISGKDGSGWFQTTLDLTAFAGTDFSGNNTFVRFKAISDWGSYNIAIDDVSGPAIFVPACPAPSNLITTNITTTTADFDWTENGTATNWTVEYKAGADFTPGTGAQDQIANVAVHPYGFAGFTLNTTYYWYVRADCGGSSSTWAGPYTFTTLPGPHPFPLTEDFESGFTYFNNETSNTIDFLDETTIIHGGTHSVHNAYTSNDINTLVETGMLDLSGTTAAQLEFWHIAKTEGGFDKCYVEISTDGGVTYTALPSTAYQGTATDYAAKGYFHEDSYATWGTSTEIPDNTWWKKETFSLASYNVANVRFRFRLTSDGFLNRDGWYIDDIHIFEPSCSPPSNLTADNILNTSTDLRWTENGTATVWNIEYGVTGFVQGQGTMINGVTSNPYSLSGLTSNTTYDYYVQSDCGVGNTSTWTGPYTFTTLCDPMIAPYSEDFTASGIPACWSQEAFNGDRWAYSSTNSAGGVASGEMKASFISGTGVSRFISPPLDLTGLTTPRLTFNHFFDAFGSGIIAKVQISLNGGTTWIDQVFSIDSANGNVGPETVSFNLSNGNAHTLIAWTLVGNHFQFDYWYIDDVSVDEAPACPQPTGLSATNTDTTTSVLNWNEAGTATTWDLAWGPTGFSPLTGTLVTGLSATTYTLSGLTARNVYDFYVRADCGAGTTSSWSGPYTWTQLGTGDFCAYPIVGTVVADCNVATPITLDFTNALVEYLPNCDLAGNFGYWIKVTMPASGAMKITNSGTSVGMVILDACSGNEIYCANNNLPATLSLTGFNASTDYWFYFWKDGQAGSADICFEDIPCPFPTSLVSSNITDTSADLSWTPGATETTWNIEYGPTGYTQGTGTVISGVTTNPYTLSGLSASTSYDWYIQADCGADKSPWSGPNTFITTPPNDLCANATLLTVGQAFADNAIITSNVGSTASGETPTPSCSQFGGGEDVWYAIIVPVSGHVIVETDAAAGSTLSDTAMAIYSGDCGNLVEVACDDDTGNGAFSLIEYFGVPDSIIYVRVFEYFNNTFDTFQISAYDTYCTGGTATWSNFAWVGGILPDSTKKVVIDDAYQSSIDGGSFDACSLEITPNGFLQIQDNDKVVVEKGILNNGDLMVESGGSLLQLSDNALNGGHPLRYNVVVQTTTLQDTDRFTYLGSPCATENTDDVFDWASEVWDFNQDTQFWNYLGTGTTANTEIEPGKGYAVRADAGVVGSAVTMSYYGTFNNGVFTQPLVLDVGTHEPTVPDDDDDATLVANPYPSGLNLINATNGLIANNTINNVLIWTHDSALDPGSTTGYAGDDYIVCSIGGCTNAPTGGSHNGVVAPGQGFFVNATAAGTLTFNNSMRVGSYNILLRNPSNDEKIWINTSNSLGYTSNILLEFTNKGTLGFDTKIDAKKPLSTTFGLSFYSVNNGNKLAIEDKGIFENNITVPVGVIVNDPNIHDLTFNIANADNFDDINVYLIDHVLNVTHDLKQANYTVNDLSQGEFNTRFEIVFSRSALSVEDTNISNNSLIVSNDNANKFKVSIKGATIKNFKAFDALGKLVIEMQPNSNSFFVENNLKEGTVLFIKATLQNGTVLTKKFVKL